MNILHACPAPNPPGATALDYFAPPCDLADLIGTFYLFTADQPRIRDATRADFAQLRFMIAGTGTYAFNGGLQIATPEVCMLGPTMSATSFEVAGPMQVFGLSLSPVGWYALTGTDACNHADALFCMVERFGDDYRNALDALRRISDPRDALGLVADLLRPRFGDVRPEHVAFTRAAEAWLSGAHSPDLEQLAMATGLSQRQLARLAKRYFGAPPKLLARKYRALRAASALTDTDGSEDVERIIGESFYDQSHVIREMKHFVGYTPQQLRNDPSVVAKLTLMRRAEHDKIAHLARIS